MLSVELGHLADLLDSVNIFPNISGEARVWSTRIHDAIWNSTVGFFNYVFPLRSQWVQVADNIFAYETNGFGGRYVMDDANVPVG
jgi:meiotically up-regulated gene 157 (Mug157) protein